ncbi:glycosyltransferase [Polynucleobacter paneuropaeus]|nr:glycosyltransferase [Polynucleobacter paneuropaeus]
MKKNLIAHVIIGLNVGGAEKMLARLIRAADSVCFEHVVISMTKKGQIGEELEHSGFKVIELGMKTGFGLPKAMFRLAIILLQLKPNIVQTWMYHADLFGGLVAKLTGFHNIIWGIRSTDIQFGRSRSTIFIRKICAFLSPYIPLIIVCAAHASKEAHIKAGYSTKKMKVIPNGFEAISPTWSEQDIPVKLQRILDKKTPIVGFVGRFNPVKGVDIFIASAEILIKKYPEVNFLMVGKGLEDSNSELFDLIEGAGLTNHIILLGEQNNVPFFLTLMDIFCLSSRSEGFPNVVGEAMLMEVPCVVTDVGDSRILVDELGIVVEPNNPKILANGLVQMLSTDPEVRKELGALSRRRIQKEFSMRSSVEKYEYLYETLVHPS